MYEVDEFRLLMGFNLHPTALNITKLFAINTSNLTSDANSTKNNSEHQGVSDPNTNLAWVWLTSVIRWEPSQSLQD